MKLDFGEVLGQMWKIGWNHKALWLLQILPGLFYILTLPFSFLGNPLFTRSLPEPWDRFASEPLATTIFSAAFFILIIPIMLAGILAQSATTYGAVKAERGAKKLSFSELVSGSLPYFWRVLGLYFVFGGAWLLLMIAFMAVNILGTMAAMELAFLCFIPFLLLMIPIAVVGYSVMELAQAAIIADEMTTMNAISHGWKLFRQNWLSVCILMVILYFALYTLSSAAIFPIMFPVMFLSMGIGNSSNNFMPMSMIILFPLMFIFIFCVQGILMAFFQSAWAVAYIRLSCNDNTPIAINEQLQGAGT